MDKKLCVAYSADDNYAKHLGISMQSLLETNKDFEEVDVFVLDCGIKDGNRERLITIAKEYKRSLLFISMEEAISGLKLNMGTRKIAIASYARLFLASVIPASYDRIIYLDCDTIVMDSIRELWNIDVKGYMAAGVRDTVDRYFYKKIGLSKEDYYVNAGILLINLNAWRKNNILDSFLNTIDEFDGKVPHHDQGTINLVCKRKIALVSARYNVNSNIYSFSAKTIKNIYSMNSYYSQEELDEAKKKPTIIHYTTGLVGRPWEENCTHPRKDAYLSVEDRSPWKGDQLLPDSRGLYLKVFSALYKHTPLFISESIYRLLNWLMHIRD